MRNSPSCSCCGDGVNCVIETSGNLVVLANWTEVSGTWSVASSVINGSVDGALLVTDVEANGTQYVSITIRANAADQVVDILLGSDDSGAADFYLRLTFGDSGVSGDCGSMQLFSSAGALEDAQPVVGLVDSTYFGMALCIDAKLKRIFGRVGQLPGITAIPLGNPSGKLGLRINDAQSSSVDFKSLGWDRIFTDETCHECKICGTAIGGALDYENSTCTYTIGTPYYSGPNIVGTSSVDANTVISAVERRQGYGIVVTGVVLLSDADTTTVEVTSGNHVARLTIGVRTAGACAGPSSTPYHVDIYTELLEGGAVQSTSTTQCCPDSFGGLEQFSFSCRLIFCDGNVVARGGVIIGAHSATAETNAAGVPVAGAHGATTDRGGINNYTVTRCLECDQCEDCQDVTDDDRSWQIEVVGTPDTFDGTYVLNSQVDCGASGSGGGLTWELIVRRHNLHIGVPKPPFGSTDYYIEGVSSGPVTNCDSIVNKVIPISGGLAFTIGVTTTQNGSGAQNEIQHIDFVGVVEPTGGTFTMTMGFNTTTPIAYNASAATVQAALEALASIGSGNVSVTGTPGDWDAEFIGALALTDVSQMSGTSSLTYFISGTVTVNSL